MLLLNFLSLFSLACFYLISLCFSITALNSSYSQFSLSSLFLPGFLKVGFWPISSLTVLSSPRLDKLKLGQNYRFTLKGRKTRNKLACSSILHSCNTTMPALPFIFSLPLAFTPGLLSSCWGKSDPKFSLLSHLACQYKDKTQLQFPPLSIRNIKMNGLCPACETTEHSQLMLDV